jgi:signal transduction histidine kinase
VTVRSATPLWRLVAGRVALFAALAMLGQSVAVLVEYASDPDDLAAMIVSREVDGLAEGLSTSGDLTRFELPVRLRGRYGEAGAGYAARVATADGETLFTSCDRTCVAKLPAISGAPPSRWVRRTSEGYPLSFVGGETRSVDGRTVKIDVAVDGDRAGGVWTALADELAEHMALPMTLTLVFTLGATLWSIRSALAPVRRAAQDAAALDPRDGATPLDPAGMPLEVAQLVEAVNRAFARAHELMADQKLFTSAIAHEIRTPLAVVSLELENSGDPVARKALADIGELTRFVSQLTALARLEGSDRSAFETVRLAAVAEEVVEQLGPWIYRKGASVELRQEGDATVRGVSALIADALRNLVENAVKHGGAGVAISVSAGPGARLSVADDGVGAPAGIDQRTYKRAGGLGVGLQIVRRIAELHGARLTLSSNAPRGVVVSLVFDRAGSGGDGLDRGGRSDGRSQALADQRSASGRNFNICSGDLAV